VGEEQVDGVVVAGLGAQRDEARQVVEHRDRAHGAGQAARVGDVELVGDALAQRKRGGAGAAIGVGGFALQREFVQPERAGERAVVGAAHAAEQRERRLLQDGGFGPGAAGGAAQHQPGELFAVRQVGFGVQAHGRGLGGAANLHAHPLGGVGPQRQDVEAGVVERAVEAHAALFDGQALAVGAVAAAHGVDLSGELWRALCRAGGHLQAPGEVGVDAQAAHAKVVAQVDADAHLRLHRGAGAKAGRAFGAAHHHVAAQGRGGLVGQQQQGLVHRELPGQVQPGAPQAGLEVAREREAPVGPCQQAELAGLQLQVDGGFAHGPSVCHAAGPGGAALAAEQATGFATGAAQAQRLDRQGFARQPRAQAAVAEVDAVEQRAQRQFGGVDPPGPFGLGAGAAEGGAGLQPAADAPARWRQPRPQAHLGQVGLDLPGERRLFRPRPLRLLGAGGQQGGADVGLCLAGVVALPAQAAAEPLAVQPQGQGGLAQAGGHALGARAAAGDERQVAGAVGERELAARRAGRGAWCCGQRQVQVPQPVEHQVALQPGAAQRAFGGDVVGQRGVDPAERQPAHLPSAAQVALVPAGGVPGQHGGLAGHGGQGARAAGAGRDLQLTWPEGHAPVGGQGQGGGAVQFGAYAQRELGAARLYAHFVQLGGGGQTARGGVQGAVGTGVGVGQPVVAGLPAAGTGGVRQAPAAAFAVAGQAELVKVPLPGVGLLGGLHGNRVGLQGQRPGASPPALRCSQGPGRGGRPFGAQAGTALPLGAVQRVLGRRWQHCGGQGPGQPFLGGL